jgi:sugar phosphate isomerase/epimerase
MQSNQIGAQLYTLRDHLKTPSDIAASLQKVRAIGYEAVQVSGMGAIEEEELLRICDGEGITICATHEPTDTILNEPQRVVERLQKLGCKYTAVPYPNGLTFDSVQVVEEFAARINRAGEVLHNNDQVLMYHNHQIEFVRVDGQLVLEILYDATDPRFLQGEIDTYWVQYGGGDSVDWCQRLQNRLPVIHLKDYAITPDNKPIMAEIGYGNLNWPAILNAAEESGCEWFVVEQDVTPGDPFDSLKMSFEFLRDNFCDS